MNAVYLNSTVYSKYFSSFLFFFFCQRLGELNVSVSYVCNRCSVQNVTRLSYRQNNLIPASFRVISCTCPPAAIEAQHSKDLYTCHSFIVFAETSDTIHLSVWKWKHLSDFEADRACHEFKPAEWSQCNMLILL